MARVGYPIGRRRWLAAVLAVLIAIVVIFTMLSRVYIDLLWYREVHLTSVFWTVLRTKIVLGSIFGLVFFGLVFSSLWIARRISPVTRVITPDQEVVERFRQGVDPHLWWLLPVLCVVLALFTGIGVSHQWQTFLLWRDSGGIKFGSTEPLFHRDPAFYVFDLPWWQFVQGWLFSSVVGVTFLTAIAHVLWGGIRPQAPQFANKVTPPVRAHLSVLFALIMLTKAWGYWLGRFNLLTSPRGVVEGASYTDVHAQLPALKFLAVAAVICAGLFLVNIRVRQWLLPGIAVALLGLVSVLFGTAYPAYVQTFGVKPQELQRETQYIQDNIQGTRSAFALDPISAPKPTITPTVTAADVAANPATISNIRLWRPRVLLENYESLQRFRQYYQFNDVAVDRYPIGGQERVLMVAGREVSQSQIPGQQTWQNQHLVYTHGFGAVAALVNTATAEGVPVFTTSNIPIPPDAQPPISQPRIYYGEGGKQGLPDVPFVVVKTGTSELDYEGATAPQAYTGQGGIPIGNTFQRALFAWRFHDVNLLISGQIHSDSRILIYRTLAERIPRPAPFLTFDGDPYLTVVGGRLTWIWDAYTTTSRYPYSQAVDLGLATDGALPGFVNYMRNSVKVTLDAYNGTLTYYANMSDPIIQVWARAFPDMFTDISNAPPDLQAHFRYPENLFQVQASQYARYHVTNPQVFFQNQDLWQIAPDPTFCGNNLKAPGCPGGVAGSLPPIHPFYQLMKLPGQQSEAFQLVLPFVPQGRPNMISLIAANSDPTGYGHILAYTFPPDVNILGPSQVFSAINQDPTFSSERTLLGTGGSTVIFGDFLVIPIQNSFLYVQPVYVRSAQATAIPELKRVVVVNDNVVGIGTTLQQALTAATGAQGPKPAPFGKTVQALLAEALKHFDAANKALTNSDLATYQAELKQAQALVQQANALANKSPTGSTGPSPSPTSPSPSPSP